MDAFDYAQEPKPRPRRQPVNSADIIWNILTLLVLLAVFVVAVVFLMIFSNPQSGINPFPPPTEVIIPTVAPQMTATATRQVVELVPTWTPAPTLEPSATPTLRPSSTPLPTKTPYGMATATSAPFTATPGGFSFELQRGSPQAIANIYDAAAGCNWMGVGGQALDLSGAPVLGLIVQFGGTLEGQPKDGLYMTGTAGQLGRGGFVIPITDHPIASKGSMWIQLLDQQGLPLSARITFDTYASCDKNLVIIYFNQVK